MGNFFKEITFFLELASLTLILSISLFQGLPGLKWQTRADTEATEDAVAREKEAKSNKELNKSETKEEETA